MPLEDRNLTLTHLTKLVPSSLLIFTTGFCLSDKIAQSIKKVRQTHDHLPKPWTLVFGQSPATGNDCEEFIRTVDGLGDSVSLFEEVQHLESVDVPIGLLP